jgi:hypothetical protein
MLRPFDKGASPDHSRCIELAFARSGGKQRLAAEIVAVVIVHPRRRWPNKQAVTGNGTGQVFAF